VKKQRGTVYLIGAGPGDPGLISVRGRDLLLKADVVVYDALVNTQIVDSLPSAVRRIFAGKRGGKPSKTQDAINRILEREATRGLRVARLKGGDPLLFGRGSEEMEFLRTRAIPFEIVPGITSAIAAPAFAGIPVTHRSVSRSVAFVTGHLKSGDSIASLAIPRADTLVFLMAMENLEKIVAAMLAGGQFTQATPAAIIQDGTLPVQKTVSGTLGRMVALRDSHQIRPPAILVVGNVVRLAKSLSWYKTPPLAGKRVVVLRTSGQSAEITGLLTELGATVVQRPLIAIRPRSASLGRIDKLWLAPFTSIAFTSPNAVDIFFRALFGKGHDSRLFAGKRVYAIGSGTAAALGRFGIVPDAVPRRFVAEGLLAVFPKDLRNENILIPRASAAREILPETLRRRGAAVTILPLYDTIRVAAPQCPVQNDDVVLFTSSSMVESYYSDKQRSRVRIVPCCLGHITAATLRRHYRGRMFVAPSATMKSLVATVVKAVRRTRRGESR
jgi:uroporphyrinogen III methyltransferase/synthase